MHLQLDFGPSSATASVHIMKNFNITIRNLLFLNDISRAVYASE